MTPTTPKNARAGSALSPPSAPPASAIPRRAAGQPLPGPAPTYPGRGTPTPAASGTREGAQAAGSSPGKADVPGERAGTLATGNRPGRGGDHGALLRPGQDAIAAAMSEDRGPDSLEAHLRRLMKELGLWGYHPRRSEKSEKGWPDWVIIGTRIIHRELKTERGKVSDEQEAVGARITAAGGDWDVWRPRDLLTDRIADELRAITAGPLGLGGAT